MTATNENNDYILLPLPTSGWTPENDKVLSEYAKQIARLIDDYDDYNSLDTLYDEAEQGLTKSKFILAEVYRNLHLKDLHPERGFSRDQQADLMRMLEFYDDAASAGSNAALDKLSELMEVDNISFLDLYFSYLDNPPGHDQLNDKKILLLTNMVKIGDLHALICLNFLEKEQAHELKYLEAELNDLKTTRKEDMTAISEEDKIIGRIENIQDTLQAIRAGISAANQGKQQSNQ